MAFTDIDNPELYFQTKLYSGTGSSLALTLDGSEDMQPDLVWGKRRSATQYHGIYDSVRGATEQLTPNTTDAESTKSETLKSFDSDGMTFGTNVRNNDNGTTNVAWNWKASNSTTNDTTSGYLANTQSVNETAGFTILKYTGSATNTATITGLSDPLDVSITKRLDDTGDWIFWHRYNTGTVGRNYLKLNTTNASLNSATIFQNIAPSMDGTKSYQAMGTSSPINVSGAEYISYGFSSRKGFSKFGSYTGNGNSDGPFIFTGFKPAFVLQKNASATQGWQLQDNKREGYNGDNDLLQPHDSAAESGVNRIDILSNGFKVITTDAGQNSSGATYIYMAFAESPFVNSNGVPTNAR